MEARLLFGLRPERVLPIVGRIRRADLLDRQAIAFPAQILPGLSIRNQRIGEVVLEAFRAECDFFDVLQDFLFVGCGSHSPTLTSESAAPNPAEVPKT